MTGTLKMDYINVVSVIAAVFLALGAVLCMLKEDIYWTMVALWSFALLIFPFYRYRDRERSPLTLLMVLVLPPYLLSFLDGSGVPGILPLGSIEYLLLSSIALFALTIVTIAFINSCSGMDLNLKFAMQVAFMMYTSLIALQAVVFYYSDLWFGTDLLASNGEIMAYITLATINGLLLTIAFFVLARGDLTERDTPVEEGAGG